MQRPRFRPRRRPQQTGGFLPLLFLIPAAIAAAKAAAVGAVTAGAGNGVTKAIKAAGG